MQLKLCCHIFSLSQFVISFSVSLHLCVVHVWPCGDNPGQADSADIRFTECVVLSYTRVSLWIQVDSVTGYLLTVDQNYKVQERSQSDRVQGEEASQGCGGLDQVH